MKDLLGKKSASVQKTVLPRNVGPLNSLRKSCVETGKQSTDVGSGKLRPAGLSYLRLLHFPGRCERKAKDFVLDCCNLASSKLPRYDDLRDNYLKYFFERPGYRRVLDEDKPAGKVSLPFSIGPAGRIDCIRET